FARNLPWLRRWAAGRKTLVLSGATKDRQRASGGDFIVANLLAGMEEASFEPVEDGYLFQSPHPLMIGLPRYYLVNEAQKAESCDRLRRRQRVALPLLIGG